MPMMLPAHWLNGVKTGDRVILTMPCGDYPISPVPAGEKGTIVLIDERDIGVAVKLDNHFPDLAHWDNEIHINLDCDINAPEQQWSCPFRVMEGAE